MRKYLTIDTRKDGNGDELVKAYDTPEEAIKAGERAWQHLTSLEQGKRQIVVAVVTENDLVGGAIDDETGEIDWCMYSSYNDIKVFE